MECDGRYLATSPELQMKQLVAAGYGPIFQLTRSFRRGEYGRRHSPEFTILEWYHQASNLEVLVDDLDALLRHCVREVTGDTTLVWQGHQVDFSRSLMVTCVREAYLHHAGWDPVTHWDPDRFDLDMVNLVEPNLGRCAPECLAYYPAQAASLARLWPQDTRLAQRLELYVEGLELANGFVELNDPAEQRLRFLDTQGHILALGRTPGPMPEQFLESLSQLPDTVGMALGVDRLAMLLADKATLEEVRAFDYLDV